MALTKGRRLTMNDGNTIPVIGFGTHCADPSQKRICLESIKIAIEVGFRHFDGAYLYGTEEQVGQAISQKIADGTIKREDIFYTGKPGPELVQKGEDGKFITDIVDLRKTWEAMEACKDAGLVKSIGVSNFNCKQLEMILNKPGLKYKPVLNQVECHAYWSRSKLLNFCKSHGILLEAYNVLGTQRDPEWIDQNMPVLLEDPVLNAIAKKYNKSPALVALRHQLQRGLVVIIKSVKKHRIEEHMQAFNFHLSDEDMKSIDGLNRNQSYYKSGIFDHHPQFQQPDN